jgi:hypothetical protein
MCKLKIDIRYVALAALMAFVVAGCLPHIPTKKAFVVIGNDSSNSIQYKALLSGEWSSPATIAAGDVEFLFDYEATVPDEVLPEYFTGLKISVESCEFEMMRGDLEKYFVKNPQGRLGWDLSIDTGLLQNFGCNA